MLQTPALIHCPYPDSSKLPFNKVIPKFKSGIDPVCVVISPKQHMNVVTVDGSILTCLYSVLAWVICLV